MDMTKAFDVTMHSLLFYKMLKAGLSAIFVRLLIFIYTEQFANPFIASKRGFIDDVIKPHSTRKRIAIALENLKNKELSSPSKKHDNIPL